MNCQHGPLALRLFFGCLVLNNIPMLNQNTVLHTQYVRRNPVHGKAKAAETSMQDYEVLLSDDRSWFVLQRWRKTLDEIEQTDTTGRDMSAVLNVFRRPESFRGRIIALVEECVERFQHEGFVLLGCSFRHLDS